MITSKEVRTAWANEELAQVITQLTALHTEFKENSGLIQHELIEQAIEKLYHAYTLSKPNGSLDYLLILDGMFGTPRQVDHFN